jgi:DNA-binding transcriptional ArsR family regulator
MGVSAQPLEVDRTLAALADPHRRRVVDLLSQGPRTAGDLARTLDLSPPAMSRHLRTLRQSGLVEESHPVFDARVRIYALRPEPMVHLLRWLEDAERLWSEQLVAFKAHLERDA